MGGFGLLEARSGGAGSDGVHQAGLQGLRDKVMRIKWDPGLCGSLLSLVRVSLFPGKNLEKNAKIKPLHFTKKFQNIISFYIND